MLRYASLVAAVVAVGLFLPLTFGAGVAEACSQPQAGWAVYETDDHRIDVPPAGLIALGATLEGWNVPEPADALGTVTVRVFDLQERAHFGTLEYVASLRAILWRASEPLTPGAGYRLEYRFDNTDFFNREATTEGAFTFEVAVAPPEPVALPTAREIELVEERRGADEVCCERDLCVPIDCGPVSDAGCDLCWPERYTYHPRLSVSYPATVDLAIARPLIWVDDEPPALGPELTAWDGSYRVYRAFDEPADRYCVALQLERLADGTTIQTEATCVDHARLEEADRITPTFEALQYCKELPPGYTEDGPIGAPRTGGLLAEQPSCGCSATTGQTRPASWLAAFGLLLLGLRRRR